MSTYGRMRLDFYIFLVDRKINSKWIKDKNVKHETIKLLEENVRKALKDMDLGKDILNKNVKIQDTKEKSRQMRL
jgi:hypothetical protein